MPNSFIWALLEVDHRTRIWVQAFYLRSNSRKTGRSKRGGRPVYKAPSLQAINGNNPFGDARDQLGISVLNLSTHKTEDHIEYNPIYVRLVKRFNSQRKQKEDGEQRVSGSKEIPFSQTLAV